MELRLNFASLSVGAAVDQQTGNLSIFEVVEEIRTPVVPIHLQSLVISLAFELSQPYAFEGYVDIHIKKPDGFSDAIGKGELKIPPDKKRIKVVFRFGAFPISAFGRHLFELVWSDAAGNEMGRGDIPFEVVKVVQVAQGVAPSNPPENTH